jgi:hypothetical protein
VWGVTSKFFGLFFDENDLLKNFLRRRRPDEAVDVHVDEGGHQELAVEPVHDAAVAWDDVTKVLKTSSRIRGTFLKPH